MDFAEYGFVELVVASLRMISTLYDRRRRRPRRREAVGGGFARCECAVGNSPRQGGQKGSGPVKVKGARAKRPGLRAMIGEPTIDCLDDEEAEMGIFNMVEECLKLPFDVLLFGVW